MIGALRQLIACHWSARRLQRYLDADPAAPLTADEVARLEQHLAVCERCGELLRQHRTLHRALSRWSGDRPVDPVSLDRMRTVLDDLVDGRRR